MLRVLSILALAATASTPPPRPSNEPIAFTLNSWGHPVAAWRIEPDGSIEYRTPTAATPHTVPATLFSRHSGPDPTRYRWVRDLLAPARRWQRKTLPCSVEATDLPYGDVRWGKSEAVNFRFGCKDAVARGVTERLGRASTQVEAWSKAGSSRASAR